MNFVLFSQVYEVQQEEQKALKAKAMKTEKGQNTSKKEEEEEEGGGGWTTDF